MRCWQLLQGMRRNPAPPTTSADARAALSKSVDDLLGGVQARHAAREVMADLGAVERRNHIAQAIVGVFREKK